MSQIIMATNPRSTDTHVVVPKQLHESAKYPKLEGVYERTMSFRNWPKGTGVKPKDLVESGFSFLNYKDRVQCFHCGLILEEWREEDIVDHEHARHLSHCHFIRHKLGDQEVDIIAATKLDRGPIHTGVHTSMFSYTTAATGHTAAAAAGPLFLSRCNSTTDISQNVPASMRPALETLHPVAPRDIRARLDTEQSIQLISMGYSKHLLSQVIGERLADTGDDFPSFMDFFLAVQHAERVLGKGAVDTLNDNFLKSIERMSNPGPPPAPPTVEPTPKTEAVGGASETKSDRSVVCSRSSESATNSDVQQLDSLRRKRECNICMDRESDTCFMPCRHLCTCESCADRILKCPVCRRKIEQCIKIYV